MAIEQYERGDDYQWTGGVPDEEQALIQYAEERPVNAPPLPAKANMGQEDVPPAYPNLENGVVQGEATLPGPGAQIHTQVQQRHKSCEIALKIMQSDVMKHPLVKGSAILVVAPIIMAGAILYGIGNLLLGIGDIMTGGPLVRKKASDQVRRWI